MNANFYHENTNACKLKVEQKDFPFKSKEMKVCSESRHLSVLPLSPTFN